MRCGVQGVKGLDRDKGEDLTRYAQLVQHPDCTRALDTYVYTEDYITCCCRCRCGCSVVVVSSLCVACSFLSTSGHFPHETLIGTSLSQLPTLAIVGV